MRPGSVTRVKTRSSRHVLYYSFIHSRQAPLDDCLSQPHYQNSLLYDYSIMPHARPISNRPGVGCRPIAGVAAAAGSRPSASSVRSTLLPLQPPRFDDNSPWNFDECSTLKNGLSKSHMLCPLTRAHCIQFPYAILSIILTTCTSACKLQFSIT